MYKPAYCPLALVCGVACRFLSQARIFLLQSRIFRLCILALLVLVEQITPGRTDSGADRGALPAGAEHSTAECTDGGTGAGALLRFGHRAASGK
jgi:hypothetical protein